MLRFRAVGAMAALVAAVFLSSSAALAAPGNGKALGHDKAESRSEKGKPSGKGGRPPAITEDDDSDGVPNTPDPQGDADNRHPSGKDKHAEGGHSGNQGNASSEPDGNGKGPERDQGGLDKPDGPGGLDLLDQDGNNGCGNDDDFEDDNEGLCLGPQRSQQARSDAPAGSSDAPAGSESVASEVTTTDALEVAAGAETSADAGAAEVLGLVVGAALGEPEVPEERVRADVLGVAAGGIPVAGGTLAFTGADAALMLLLALSLALAGWLLIAAGRRRAAGA